MLKNELTIEQTDLSSSFIVQIPGQRDLANISQMPTAGFDKAQQHRLTNITKSIPKNSSQIISTDDNESKMSNAWEYFFKQFYPSEKTATRHAGSKNKLSEAKKAFDMIPDEDPIKKALLAVHSKPYVEQIIEGCIEAMSGENIKSDELRDRYKKLDEDVVLQPHTFEVLIRDFATTINIFSQQNTSASPTVFSIGLPTHHAHRNTPSGFCIFNKVAMLMEFFKHQYVIICGLDINADNGLRNCLNELIENSEKKTTPQVFIHYDVYDSQVWPNEEFKRIENKKNQKEYYYHPINLKEAGNNRKKHDIHPVMQKLIEEIRLAAKKYGSSLAIYIPLGWDSHQLEQAACGKVSFKDPEKEKTYQQEKRFNDNDFNWFYSQLMEIKKEFKINFLYIGLEGGYTQSVYQSQVQTLVEIGSQREANTAKSKPGKKKLEDTSSKDIPAQKRSPEAEQPAAPKSKKQKGNLFQPLVEISKDKKPTGEEKKKDPKNDSRFGRKWS